MNAANPLAPTAAEDANDSNSPRRLAPGATVVWTYLVTNTGTAAFTVTSLVDDNGTPTTADDFSPRYVSGDTNTNNLVDVGETWLYTSAGVIIHQAQVGLHGNIATVDVRASGVGSASAQDPAYYLGSTSTAGIVLKKAVNAANPAAPTTVEDANNASNPRPLTVGAALVWTYLVSNAGTSALTITSLRDDNGTPMNPADDFFPQYASGDANTNNLLDPGETWLYTSAGVVSRLVQAGVYGNTATVAATGSAGTAFALDPAYHLGTTQGVILKKAVNAANPLAPTAAEDADDVLNPRKLVFGTPVVWTYLVTNPGSAPLTITSLVDDHGTATTADDFSPRYVSGDADNDGRLDPNEMWLYTSAGVVSFLAETSPYGNTATVTAGTVTDTDRAFLVGTEEVVLVGLQKAVNAANPLAPTAAEDANDPLNPRRLTPGATVVWTYLVTNRGITPFTVTSLVDDNGTPTNLADDFRPRYVSGDNGNNLVDVGETWLFTSSGVVSRLVQTGLFGNTATVIATGLGGGSASTQDPAYYFGTTTTPGIILKKAVNAANPAAPTTIEDANDPNAPRPLMRRHGARLDVPRLQPEHVRADDHLNPR